MNKNDFHCSDPMTPETDDNLTIGDLMPSVPDPILTIKSYRECGKTRPILPRISADFRQFGGRYRADGKVGIGDPMPSVPDPNL
jgi:hypothetical protein